MLNRRKRSEGKEVGGVRRLVGRRKRSSRDHISMIQVSV